MTILIDFDILQQQLSMIAFSYALIPVLRLRYTVEEHSGKILATGSEYKWLWYDLEVMRNWIFPNFLDLITQKMATASLILTAEYERLGLS